MRFRCRTQWSTLSLVAFGLLALPACKSPITGHRLHDADLDAGIGKDPGGAKCVAAGPVISKSTVAYLQAAIVAAKYQSS
jgi:hypothetical protein